MGFTMKSAEKTPLVTVLINNYNYARYLRDAIDSALCQTYKPTEVVVVDDGSIDGSQNIIGQYGDQIRSVFKSNGGQGSAINAGFAASRGEIICLLDADDYFGQAKVDRVVGALQSQPGAGWIFHPVNRVTSAGTTEVVPRLAKPL